jgi:hypothetical protein
MRLIFIYGQAASGKLTVARQLAEMTGLALFHNHLVVDAVGAVFPFGSEAFVRLREQFWLAVVKDAVTLGRSLIFTFAPEASVAPDFPERMRSLVEASGGTVTFVKLQVSESEQERRIVDPSRAAFGKLRSLELLRELRPQFDDCSSAMPEPMLAIDTDVVLPIDAARMIAEALQLQTSANALEIVRVDGGFAPSTGHHEECTRAELGHVQMNQQEGRRE